MDRSGWQFRGKESQGCSARSAVERRVLVLWGWESQGYEDWTAKVGNVEERYARASRGELERAKVG